MLSEWVWVIGLIASGYGLRLVFEKLREEWRAWRRRRRRFTPLNTAVRASKTPCKLCGMYLMEHNDDLTCRI